VKHAMQPESKSELLYRWRFAASQLVLVPSPLKVTTRDFFLQLTIAVIVLM
jgi:hypothetical protein